MYDEPMDERFSLLKQVIARGVKSGYTDTDREAIDALVRELNSEYESWPDEDAYFFLDFYNDDFAVEDDQTTIPFALHERRVLFDSARGVVAAFDAISDDPRHVDLDTPEVQALLDACSPLGELFRLKDAIKHGELND